MSFLLFLAELCIIGAAILGIYYMEPIKLAIAGGDLYVVLILIVLGVLQLIILVYGIKRIYNNSKIKSELYYTVGDGEGSYFGGFLLGFLFGFIGLIIAALACKTNTKKGAIIGIVITFGLILLSFLSYFVLFI